MWKKGFSINTPKILVIDDSATCCHFMAHALRKAGYEVDTVSDAGQGFLRALQERPSCLILDVLLPGASGFDLCRKLRAREAQRSLPIVMVSTKNTPLDQRWGLAQGADCYLPKPFTEEALVQAVTGVVPPRLRPVVHPMQIPAHEVDLAEQQMLAALKQLVPRRNEDTTLMRWSSPLAGSVVIADKHARRLYAAIDGRKNAHELCAGVGLDIEELCRALELLLAQRCIQLYEPSGRLADSSLLFSKR